MSRMLLLSLLVLWMSPRDNARSAVWDAASLSLFFAAYAVLVIGMSAWSRLLARRVGDDLLGRSLDRYNKATEIARYFVPVWFAAGLFLLGWGQFVLDVVARIEPFRTGRPPAIGYETYWKLPGLLLGTLPPLLAWMGLWWAQYPADRALKEQSALYHINEGLPVHAPPAFGTFFVEHFRQQLLFTLAPILLIIAAKDLVGAGFVLFGSQALLRVGGDVLFLPLSVAVFLFAPELLRRIIPTTPLPPNWPLRRRLEALCQRAGLRYRDILVWQTNSSMGNAMVMGLFSRVRYVFLSDLLIETMRDDEIEAVFAHELGHVVHRHMWWYLIFVMILVLFSTGPLSTGLNAIGPSLSPAAMEQISAVIGFVLFIAAFGFLSRRFERQADVYAARTMQAVSERPGGVVAITHVNPQAPAAPAVGLFVPNLATAGATIEAAPTDLASPLPRAPLATTRVGEYGASVVSSALHRVARINNIPLAAHEWLHGSIASRMRYLKGISTDGDGHATRRFDKYMRRLYWSLLAILAAMIAWNATYYALPVGP